MLASGLGASAQPDDFVSNLPVNTRLDRYRLCTAEQIEAFHASFEMIQAQADNIPAVDSVKALKIWFDANSDMTLELYLQLRQSCDPAKQLYLALDLGLMRRLFNQMFRTERAVPADDPIPGVGELLEANLAAIASGDRNRRDWPVNRHLTDVPECSLEAALRFQERVDEFELAVPELPEIPKDDRPAILSWVERLETWADEAWAGFRSHPCGETRPLIDFMEAFVYTLALDWTYYDDEIAASIDRAFAFLRDKSTVDAAALKRLSKELR